MTPIEDRLHELMDRLDHRENRIQPSDKILVFEAIQRLRSAYRDVRELEDKNEKLKKKLKNSNDLLANAYTGGAILGFP